MIKSKSLTIWLPIIALTTSPGANAYELATHARVTQAAISRSVLYDSQNPNNQFFKSLGLEAIVLSQSGGFATNPFGESYYDVSENAVNARTINAFEARFMPVADTELLTLPAWIMRGAIREDDWTGVHIPLACNEDAPNPQDDPYPSPPDRPLNHFFDPAGNIPLTVFGVARGQRNPDWALGTTDAFAQPNTPDPNRRNHFTIFDAREAMFRALTLKQKAADGSYSDLSFSSTYALPTKEAQRKAYWATAFRALGDVMHLVEDMGQPQHNHNSIPIPTAHDARSLA